MTDVDPNVCRKTQGRAEPGNSCLQTPGTCESCPDWNRPKPDDITRNRHGGNAESEKANAAIHKNKEAVRKVIYEYVASQGRRGATADEVAAFFDCNHNHVAPRISELKRDGRLMPTKFRRNTRSGCSAGVVVTDAVYREMNAPKASISLQGGLFQGSNPWKGQP